MAVVSQLYVYSACPGKCIDTSLNVLDAEQNSTATFIVPIINRGKVGIGEARAIINKHAEWLNKNKGVKITIEGHCDERGTAEYNLALGERRAEAAAKYLINMGIDAKRIKTISYGLENPLDPGHNEEAWAKNRRGHFSVFDK